MFRTSSVHHQGRFVQAVFVHLVCGNTRITGHVQPLQSCRKTTYVLQVDTRSTQCQVFKNVLRSRSHGKILDTMWMTQIKFCTTVENQAALVPLPSGLLHGRIWYTFSEMYILVTPNIICVRISHEMNLENEIRVLESVSTYLIYY